MQAAQTADPLAARVSDVLKNFIDWLATYGETSWDFQSFFAGPIGGQAKALYYRHRLMGTAAVAPMIFCEAFLPRREGCSTIRCDFRLRMLITRWALLSFTRRPEILATGKRDSFSNELKKSRCPEFKEYCWGYQFNWVWRGGTIKRANPAHHHDALRL